MNMFRKLLIALSLMYAMWSAYLLNIRIDANGFESAQGMAIGMFGGIASFVGGSYLVTKAQRSNRAIGAILMLAGVGVLIFQVWYRSHYVDIAQ